MISPENTVHEKQTTASTQASSKSSSKIVPHSLAQLRPTLHEQVTQPLPTLLTTLLLIGTITTALLPPLISPYELSTRTHTLFTPSISLMPTMAGTSPWTCIKAITETLIARPLLCTARPVPSSSPTPPAPLTGNTEVRRPSLIITLSFLCTLPTALRRLL